MLDISNAFDGGNIECIQCSSADDIQVSIRKDNESDFFQWFYFRLTGAAGRDCVITLTNAGAAAYVDGFKNYSPVASYDRSSWFRVDATFDGTSLRINFAPEKDSVYLAYFAPYTMERHADLIAWSCQSPLVEYEKLCTTLDGHDLDLLKIGDQTQNKKAFWLIARQHPGETMAEWWMEGFISRLLDSDDAVSREILRRASFYIVPNMNPDGSKRGNLRTNACGRNLNREWLNPSAEFSPEVYYVLERMRQTGVDFCLDVHGDEALPYNFIAGPEGVKSWSPARQEGLDFYKNELATANPDFQTVHGYPVDAPGKANMNICTNYIAETFSCLAMTLEMPFKDTADSPDEVYGWSPDRCQKLGESNIDVIYRYLLRNK